MRFHDDSKRFEGGGVEEVLRKCYVLDRKPWVLLMGSHPEMYAVGQVSSNGATICFKGNAGGNSCGISSHIKGWPTLIKPPFHMRGGYAGVTPSIFHVPKLDSQPSLVFSS